MKSHFPEGHDVFSTDLQFVEESRDFEDRQRTLALIGDYYGVVFGLDVTDASVVVDNKLTISAGLAINEDGYRINLASETTIAGITAAHEGYYVAIYVDNTDILSTAHPITGASGYTREIDGASLTLVSSVAEGTGYVALACITNVVSGGAPSISFSTAVRSCRHEMRVDPEKLGTGLDVTEHRLSTHCDGISGGTGSLIPTIINSTIDYIAFTDMQTDNWVSINGVLLGTDETNPVADVAFSGSDLAGAYNIYIDASGSTGKTQAALSDTQFLICTVDFVLPGGDLENLQDLREFYEITQDLVRVDLVEAETNDSLTRQSTIKNNLNRIRNRLNVLETTGRAYVVIANSGGDYNGATDAVFTQAINDMPAAGGTIVVADGVWNFGNAVNVNKSIRFDAGSSTVINTNVAVSPFTAFSVSADEVVFDSFTFNVNSSVGGTQHIISFNDVDHGSVVNSLLLAETASGNLYGEMVLVNGGNSINIYNCHYHTETSQMYLVRVDGASVVSGLKIRNNAMMGDGNANLLHVDSGGVQLLCIDANSAQIGNAGGLRTWIMTDSGTEIHGMSIVSNQYQCYNTTAATIPIAFALSHTGDAAIVGNTIQFADPGTTFPLGINLGAGEFTVGNNIIRDSHLAIGISGNYYSINSNIIIGATSKGIQSTGDGGAIVGNTIRGNGSVGLDLSGDGNIADNNIVDGFTDDVSDTGAGNYVNENPAQGYTANITTV